ncbi:MAG: hypothetical protein ACJ75H_24555 [Thermoanaerobaculia bacterium]
MTFRVVAALLVSGSLLFGLAAGAQTPAVPPGTPAPPDTAPQESFADEITVALSTVVVRVVDTWGKPILGLSPRNFRARVGKTEIPVVAADWYGTGEADEPDTPTAAPEAAAEAEAESVALTAARPGRLVLVFVQADLNPSRISGQLRLRPYTEELLASLPARDHIAVVSYDSHLKLRQDFTRDRQATHAAIDEGMLFGEAPTDLKPGEPSLARHFDFAAAKEAASPERGLELTAEALSQVRGEKLLIFLGWGLGRFSGDGVHMTPAFYRAVRALGKAKAPVFVLDITSADGHSLEAGLQSVAEATGGMYLSTFRLPNLATDVLAKAISGYYVITLDPGGLTGVAGRVTLELRGKRGTILARPAVVR